MEAVLSAIENHVGASIYFGVIIVAVAHNIGRIFTTTHEHYRTDCYEYDDNDEMVVKHKLEICYKSNKPCVHYCKGLCRESC